MTLNRPDLALGNRVVSQPLRVSSRPAMKKTENASKVAGKDPAAVERCKDLPLAMRQPKPQRRGTVRPFGLPPGG